MKVKVMADKKFTNRLINETSPYLLQHAHNPVDWYPWGDEAFATARKENKPVFLSIGYSACHWCHVMEHESFEDEATAEIMNKLFVNIKVDREERPDVDSIYMNVVQMLTGHGGWPMSVFLTPEKKPFYGGTYFPNTRKYNMPSFTDVLTSISKAYIEKRDELDSNIAVIMSGLQNINEYKPSDGELNRKPIDKAAEQLEDHFDSRNGGFGSQPKFPNTFNLDLLLRQYLSTKDKKYLEMVELTLTKMVNGGIYDQLGGGFFRYSVDSHWLIPHFEKMLYDNSALIKLLLEVYQVTKNPLYKNKAVESLEYVIREMYQPEGGFYSTQDADSEGEEGKFYTWKPAEVYEILGEKNGEIFCEYFDITKYGNFEHGKSNLQVQNPPEDLAKDFNIAVEEIVEILEKGRKTLFNVRDKRVYPGKDTKVLTSWNALMISAFVKGYEVLREEKYLEIAEKSVEFIFSKLYKDGLLLRTYRDGQAKLNAYLEDYAFLIDALIDLHQVTLEEKYLAEAKKLNRTMEEQFWDEKDGGFFSTGKSHEELIVRSKEILDHSIPSANGVAARDLIRLSRLTENKELDKKAATLFKVFASTFNKYYSGVSGILCVLEGYLKPPADIVLVGKNHQEIRPFLKKIGENYNPDRLVYFLDNTNSDLSLELHKDKVALSEQPTAYVCFNFTCTSPVTSPDEMVLDFHFSV
jgi:uncharacterized protein YyaL (SSP411 family)